MIAYVVKNLWGYEAINPVPANLPDVDTFYITDTEENRIEALNKGWDYVYCATQFKHETDLLKRRSIVGFINCFPERICEVLRAYHKVFVCDSNIITLPSNYSDFVNSLTDQACALTSGYYKGEDDNIEKELLRSIHSRWIYNAQPMIDATQKYIAAMKFLGIDPLTVSVSSAKYIGWNLRNPMRQQIATYVADEYENHLQGNLIFTYVSARWKDYVVNFRDLKNDVSFSPHNYIA